MIKLRPYQQKAQIKINQSLNNSKNPLLVMPTGTGKTKTATAIIADRIALNQRVYVLTPQEEIFEQWIADLAQAGLNPGYINQEGIRGVKRGVYVCMPLTLVNCMFNIPEEIHPDEIWTDECHHSAAESWEAIYGYFSRAKRVGLTATPRRTDNKPIGHLYTHMIEGIKMSEAIQKHYLSTPMVVAPEEYAQDIPMKGDEFDLEEQKEKLEDGAIIGNVISEYNKIFTGKPVLVACCTFGHAKDMAQKFEQAGWRWAHIHSQLPRVKRKAIIHKLSTGQLNGVCTVGIGIEGMDIPGLYGLIWLRRTASLTIYMQFNGRVLRPLPGKTHGIIVDCVGNTVLHGLPGIDREWKLTDREDELPPETPPIIKCPRCMTYNSAKNDYCHMCGCDFSVPTEGRSYSRMIPTMVDGPMVVVNEDGSTARIQEVVQAKQEGQKMEDKRKEKEKETAKVSESDKVSLVRDNLFKSPKRRGLFNDAVKNFI